LLLLGGDLVALLLFAAIGRGNHGEAVRACATPACLHWTSAAASSRAT